MDNYGLGLHIGELLQHVKELKAGQTALRGDVRLIKRLALLAALWSTTLTGHINSELISDVLAAVLKKLAMGLIGF